MNRLHETRASTGEEIEGMDDMLDEVNDQLFADIRKQGEQAKRADLEDRLLQAWLNKLKGILAKEVESGMTVLHDHLRIEDLEAVTYRQMEINDSTNATLRMLIDEVKSLKGVKKPGNVVHLPIGGTGAELKERFPVIIDEDVQPVLREFLNWFYEVWLDRSPGEYVFTPREKVLGEFLVFRANRFGEK